MIGKATILAQLALGASVQAVAEKNHLHPFIVAHMARNFKRRPKQRALIAARMANQKVGKPKANSADSHDKPVSLESAAKSMNVSRRTVAEAKTVLKDGGSGMIAAFRRRPGRATLDYDSLRAAIEAGKTAREIAAENGNVLPSAVYKAAKRWALPSPKLEPHPLTRLDRDELLAALKSGKTVKEIFKQSKVKDINTIYAAVRRWGFRLPRRK